MILFILTWQMIYQKDLSNTHVKFLCDRPAVSRGSKAPPKVRQHDRQSDSGKKRRNQPIQVIQIDSLKNSLFLSLLKSF